MLASLNDVAGRLDSLIVSVEYIQYGKTRRRLLSPKKRDERPRIREFSCVIATKRYGMNIVNSNQ
jgi:hypothetical protein